MMIVNKNRNDLLSSLWFMKQASDVLAKATGTRDYLTEYELKQMSYANLRLMTAREMIASLINEEVE